ncbi:hypothetical protein ACIBH1_46955 [Nonomuraea sp. NPDC050663]|uniref:hypothetical protein n=1 Tax=Nonomuraea sp. NPDC050663 TaxID=3364370 RepID=UPI00379E5046
MHARSLIPTLLSLIAIIAAGVAFAGVLKTQVSEPIGILNMSEGSGSKDDCKGCEPTVVIMFEDDVIEVDSPKSEPEEREPSKGDYADAKISGGNGGADRPSPQPSTASPLITPSKVPVAQHCLQAGEQAFQKCTRSTGRWCDAAGALAGAGVKEKTDSSHWADAAAALTKAICGEATDALKCEKEAKAAVNACAKETP